jgi:brefeldin A-resistance guanine nucleotide exchange factor 1
MEVLLISYKEYSFIRAPVVLHTLSSLNRPTTEKAAVPIIKGLMLCLRKSRLLRNEIVNTPDFWSMIRNLQGIQGAAGGVFELLSEIMDDTPSAVTADNYEAAVLLLNDFATASGASVTIEPRRERNTRKVKPSVTPTIDKNDELVQRGIRAVSMILQMSQRVPSLIEQSHLERTEAWSTYWSPIFRALTAQSINVCREIRHHAFSSLQRALLLPELASPDHQEWTAIFDEVLFPLISQLLKPEVYQSDPTGMSETRVQAATLLCKIFLNYLVLLSEWDGMLDLWLKILDTMDRLMNSSQNDSLVSYVCTSHHYLH